MKHHFTPVRMTFIKETKVTKCWQGHGEKQALVHCWWVCKLVQLLQKAA